MTPHEKQGIFSNPTLLLSCVWSEIRTKNGKCKERSGQRGGVAVVVGRGWKGTKTGQGRAAHIFPLLCFYSLRLTGNALRCFRESFLLQEKLSRLIIKPENRRVVGHDRARFLLMFLPDHSHIILLWLTIPYSFIKYSILFTFWEKTSLLENAAPRVALVTCLLPIVSPWNNCPWCISCAARTPALLVH